METFIALIRRLIAGERIELKEIQDIVSQYPYKKQIKFCELLEATTYCIKTDYDYAEENFAAVLIIMRNYTPFARFHLEGFLQEIKAKDDLIFMLFQEYLAAKKEVALQQELQQDDDDYENNIISLFG